MRHWKIGNTEVVEALQWSNAGAKCRAVRLDEEQRRGHNDAQKAWVRVS